MNGAAAIIGYMNSRREPRVGLAMTAAARNVRALEKIYPHESPDHERQGDILARPARQQIAVFQSIASILSVMRDIYGVSLFAPTHNAATLSGPGAHLAWAERANVVRRPAVAYGSLVSLDVSQTYRYPLLGVK